MPSLSKSFLFTLVLICLLAEFGILKPEPVRAGQVAPVESRPSFAEPAISPDNSEIAFVSGDDIWTASLNGGEARLLVSDPAEESRPIFSPDGKRLAFISDRTGNGDIYLLTFATGELTRLTFDDGLEQLDAWSRDGKWVYFSSSSQEISGMNDLFRVSVDGGTPMAVSSERYVNEFWAAPSPDGKSVAFSARGIANRQWWRNGRSHLDQCEIWVKHEGSAESYERLTGGGVKEMWPMWSPDGRHLYFVSDRSGSENLWVKPISGAARQITRFKDGRLLWPGISYDGKWIVFERDFNLWKLDTSRGEAARITITRRGLPAVPTVQNLALTNQFQELALSPDGKKVAFAVRGEIFAASASDGGTATRVTRTPVAESQIVWTPDSKKIVYVSDRDRANHLYLYDFTANSEKQLTRGETNEYTPTISPDGKTLTFIRDGRELRAIDLEGGNDRLLAKAYLERPPITADRPVVWSPDGQWIAYLSAGDRAFTNVNVVPASGGESRSASFLANAFSSSVAWSPDGKYILFNTAQRTEDGRLARIDLVPRTPRFREDQFRDLFKDEPPRAPRAGAQPAGQSEVKDSPKTEKQPVEINFEGIRQRLSFIPVGVDAGTMKISPDGKWVLMTASAEGQQNLYLYSLDELAREPAVARQLTSTPGFKSDAQFTPDSKQVFYLEGGRINIINIDTRQVRPLAVTAEMDVDFAKEKVEVFHQAWTYMRDHFYDDKFHGADWPQVRQNFAPQIAGAQTPGEMRRLINLMIGELNGSHLGISAPPGGRQSPPVGRLGLRFDRSEFESAGRLKVTEVIDLGPAAITGQIRAGDILVSVDGAQIDARTDLNRLLENKVNRRVELIVTSASGDRRTVVVRPVNLATEKGLLYRHWVNDSRAYVERTSGGRLGYVHMFDMSANSLTQLYADLDIENHAKDGVVIDVRNNNGGFVNAYAIDVFARRGYMTMTVRGFPPAPARSALGQRALERPTILVTNQHSLSDAEDFTEGYRSLKLGKVVGEPTAGWIIYTWNTALIDGSRFRLPRQKVQDSAGQVMELNPRQVDLNVVRPIGEGASGKDSQLDAAVRELLKQVESRK